MQPFADIADRSFDFSQYTGQVKWVRERTIFVTRHGSHAYGTNLPGSDLDLRAICIPPSPYYLGNLNKFEQTQNKAPKKKGEDEDEDDEDPDFVIFGINKFFKLAIECNPNAIELLFTDPSDHLHVSALGQTLLDHRRVFLTQRAKHTFSGYAISQLGRIKRHYRWLKNPPKAPPTRAEMGLPERTLIPKDQLAAANAAIQKQLDRWNFKGLGDVTPDVRIALQRTMAELLAEIQVSMEDVWKGAARVLGMDDNFIELLDKERQYLARKKEWESYQGWLKKRNPARAELEAKFGYDTKHAMHLFRLFGSCREVLTTGDYHVRRPDAQELLAIRAGCMTIDEVFERADREDKELQALLEQCTLLPHDPPRVTIDELLISLVGKGLR